MQGERRKVAHLGRSQSDHSVGDELMPLVSLIMGSKSDWKTMEGAATLLDLWVIPYESLVISAHRTPERLFDYAKGAKDRGVEVVIAGAGGAAHLPGMVAALTRIPVIGVPIDSTVLHGVDALLSIAQMPAGTPVATMAIGKPGAVNAAILAAMIVGAKTPRFQETVNSYRDDMSRLVPKFPTEPLDEKS
jgi:5-(carboxyamino)imidazole ribonucleotide mutase